jgi:hypothetical protein
VLFRGWTFCSLPSLVFSWHDVCINGKTGRFEVEPVGSAGLLARKSVARRKKGFQMKNLKVSLGFTRLPDGELSALIKSVIANMTNNAAFSTPPVSFPELTKLLEAFDAAMAAAMNGGTKLTVAKNAAREVLLAALRKMAAYVQIVADGDMALLLASGFSTISRNRSQAKLDVPLILSVGIEGTTKLNVRLRPVVNAKSYELRAFNGSATPVASLFSTQARRIVVENLTPGTTYNLQVRAIGGSEGYSEWSDPVSRMAT